MCCDNVKSTQDASQSGGEHPLGIFMWILSFFFCFLLFFFDDSTVGNKTRNQNDNKKKEQ